MTQAELENELATLRSRLTQLEDEQSANRSQWDRIASQCKWLGVLFAVAAVAFGFAQMALSGHLAAPLAMPFVLTAIVLGLLGQPRSVHGRPR
jgi:cellulase/cellobiase CelA1